MSDEDSGGALALSRAFTQFGEQSGSSVTVNGSELYSWEVERDNAGRITSKTETLSGTSTLYEYTYDSLGRLTEVTANGEIMEEYAYGANGARSLETNAWRGITDRSYSYGADHRLLQAGDTTYEYNADGFLTSKTVDGETTTYTYASTGELLAVGLPDGSTIAYKNDALGRRVAKYIDGVVTEKYLWQGRTQLLAVYNADGSLKSRFLYADARMPVAMETGGQTYYLACDQVGSLRAVADASGTVVKTVTYDSFGNVLEDSNESLAVPFGFAGGLYDADTGLVRFGYRDYDAEVGRWTAKDPIGFGGGDSDLYGYCGGDPVDSVDINGKKELYRYGGGGATLSIPAPGVPASVSVGVRSYKDMKNRKYKKICLFVSYGWGPGWGGAIYVHEGLINDDLPEKTLSYNESYDFKSADGFCAFGLGGYTSVSEKGATFGTALGLGVSVTGPSEELVICFDPTPCWYERKHGKQHP